MTESTINKKTKEKRNLASLIVGCSLIPIGIIIFAITNNLMILMIEFIGAILALMGGLRKW